MPERAGETGPRCYHRLTGRWLPWETRGTVPAMTVSAEVAVDRSRRPALGRALRLALPPFAREAGIAAAAAFVYFLIRGSVVDRVDEATARAESLFDLEGSLAIAWEPAMQDWILGSPFLIDLFNGIYFWTHMPLIIGVALLLYWKRPRVYRLVRNAFVVSAAIGLALYFTLPLAPPRFFAELGFVDTMALYAEANYQAQELGLFVNPYAAMPSLHFGWALLIGIGLWLARPASRPAQGLVGLFAALIVAGQFFAVVLTGNHWILDAVAGALVAAGALAFTLALRYRSEQRRKRDRSERTRSNDAALDIG